MSGGRSRPAAAKSTSVGQANPTPIYFGYPVDPLPSARVTFLA
jgi:hypothetical protein